MKYLLIIFLFFISCSQDKNEESEIVSKLKKIIPEELTIISFNKSELENFYEVELSDGTYFYLDREVQHIFLGDLFRIEDKQLVNLSYVREKEKIINLIENIDRGKLITFEPDEKKYEVFVFTDVDCGFCRKFHSQISNYLEKGIEINYLSFPREGLQSETANKLMTAWCSEDQKKVLTELKLGKSVPYKICDSNPIQDHYNLAKQFGISGTPTFITGNGFNIPGLIEVDELIEYLK